MGKETDYGQTILPIDVFRRLMGIDPYHFWQMTFTGHPMVGYSQIYPHERWMYSDQAMPATSAKRGPGRLDVIEAVVEAEMDIAQFHALRTWPGPMYSANEKIVLTKPAHMFYQRNRPYILRTDWRHIDSVGTQTYTPIQMSAALVYVVGSDDVTCTVTSTVSLDEIVVCYEDTVIPIRPIDEITRSGNTVTITLKRWLCAEPELWETGDTIDAVDELNLIDAVDVYRVWIDPSSQILLAWDPMISACGCLDVDSCTICAQATRTACGMNRDYEAGLVAWQMATYDAATGEWGEPTQDAPQSRFPDYAYISYQHGLPTMGDRYMMRHWQTVISRLAAARMPDYVYDRTSQPEILYHWRQDMAEPLERGRRGLSQSDLGNPFGTKRGEIYAWHQVLKYAGGG